MTSKLRLVFVVTEDWYFWSHRAALAQAAAAAGYEVILVAREGEHGECIRQSGIRFIPWHVQRGRVGLLGEVRALLDLCMILRRLRPDLVHNVALKPMVFGTFAARVSGRAKVVNALVGLGFVYSSKSERARRLRPLVRFLLRLVLGWLGHQVIVQNPEDGEWVRRAGVDPSQIALIRGAGVDIQRFSPKTPPEDGSVIVSMVSRMLRDKGVPVLVEAARRLAVDCPGVQVQLVGPTDPGNLASMTEQELEALHAEGVVRWVGAREDVERVWAESHIAVLPSSREGLPKSLLEAAACARPIIATDTPGCREIVRHGETGLLVPTDDAVSLADAIARLAGDRDLRETLGRRARQLVEAELADAIINERVLHLYAELTA